MSANGTPRCVELNVTENLDFGEISEKNDVNFCNDTDTADDEDGEDEEENCDDIGGDARCIFGSFKSTSIEEVWRHMADVHGFCLGAFSSSLRQFGYYGRAALINYLRDKFSAERENECSRISISEIQKALSEISPLSQFWKDEKFLVPLMRDDRLLWDDDGFDHQDDNSDGSDEPSDKNLSSPPIPPTGADGRYHSENKEAFKADQNVSLEEPNLNNIQRSTSVDPASGSKHFDVCKSTAHRSAVSNPLRTSLTSGSKRLGDLETSRLPVSTDHGYFESYSYLDIHRDMILDDVRTGAYASFIETHADCFRDKVVLDVGCGTGILSMFCARAGARKVVGVDAAVSTLEVAKSVINQNGFADRIQLLAAKLEDVTLYTAPGSDEVIMLPCDETNCDRVKREGLEIFRCDCIISEWMGYCLLFESMLFTVIHARNKYLRSNGRVFPDQATMYCALADYTSMFKASLDIWDKEKIYGLDLRALKPAETRFLKTPIVDSTPPQWMRSRPDELFTIFMENIEASDLREIHAEFQLDLFYQPCTPSGERPSSTPHVRSKIVNGMELLDPSPGDLTYVPPNTNTSASSGGTSLVLWFDCHFHHRRLEDYKHYGKGKCQHRLCDLDGHCDHVTLTTNPLMRQTHWAQTVLHLVSPGGGRLFVEPTRTGGRVLYGSLYFSPNPENPRCIQIALGLYPDDLPLKDKKGCEGFYNKYYSLYELN